MALSDVDKADKRTFTRWINYRLDKTNPELHVNDLFEDLRDGRLLIRLLEIISGEKVGPSSQGTHYLNKIDNASKALQFLNQKKILQTELSAEEIVAGSPKPILGMMWQIFVYFQIPDIPDEELLHWCQRETEGHHGVKVINFNAITSWSNGLAFNALIHKHRPDLVEYNSLRRRAYIANLNNAFDVAEKQLGLPRLLDAEDMELPDRYYFIMTYLYSYYLYFTSKVKTSAGIEQAGSPDPKKNTSPEVESPEVESPDLEEDTFEEETADPKEDTSKEELVEVEVEEEELQTREVEREVVIEVLVPYHMRTYYHYQGRKNDFMKRETYLEWGFEKGEIGIEGGFELGELLYLLLQLLFNKEFVWCGRHQNSQEFGKYVKEVKLKKVKKVTKIKVREEVLVKVKRKKMVERKVPKQDISHSRIEESQKDLSSFASRGTETGAEVVCSSLPARDQEEALQDVPV